MGYSRRPPHLRLSPSCAAAFICVVAMALLLIAAGGCTDQPAASAANGAKTPLGGSSNQLLVNSLGAASPEATTTPGAEPTETSTPTLVPSPQPTATPANTRAIPSGPGSLPFSLRIPKIGVNALVEQVGLTPEGAMAVPKRYDTVGWYMYGPRPGQPGNSAIAGHLDQPGAAAVFWRLKELTVGDLVYVLTADQVEIPFVVVDKVTYKDGEAPLERIFGPSQDRNLNLITCGGVFNQATHNYSERLIVYTQVAP